MFAPRISELGMLTPSPDTGILNAFPLSVRRKLISEITQCLLPRSLLINDPGSILKSAAHVKWMMEVVGQGFSLPLEDVSVIQDSINVYHQWLLDEPTRPWAIRNADKDPNLVQQFFQHYSLLFIPRVRLTPTPLPPTKTSEMEDCLEMALSHVDLCKKVLNIILSAAKTIGHCFTSETWIVLLKVMLGVCDTLLKEPVFTFVPGPVSTAGGQVKSGKAGAGTMASAAVAGSGIEEYETLSSGPMMGDKLCEFLSRKYYASWGHRIEVINHWSATIVGITKRVVGHLSGTDEDTQTVVITISNGYTITVDISYKFLKYTWHRMIYLMVNPCTLGARNFLVAVTGISKVVGLLQAMDPGPNELVNLISEDPNILWFIDGSDSLTRIDGNTILHMFGEWLFNAATMSQQGYEEGRAEALGSLCRIFSKFQRASKFLRVYLERFYSAMMQGLRADILSLTSIIMNSSDLFAMELEGARILVPSAIMSLYRVLPLVDATKTIDVLPASVSVEQLRRASYKMLGTLMSVLNRFEDAPITPLHMDTALLAPHHYLSNQIGSVLRPHILNLLAHSLAADMHPKNIRYILNLITCYVVEEATFCPGIASVITRIIQDKLLMQDHWPCDAVIASLDCLNTLSTFWEHVIGNAKYIESQLASGNLVAAELNIMRAYDTLFRWCIVGTWLFDDHATQRLIISTITRGIVLLDRDKEFAVVNTSAVTGSTGSGHRIISAADIAVFCAAGNTASSHSRDASQGMVLPNSTSDRPAPGHGHAHSTSTSMGNAILSIQLPSTPTGTIPKKAIISASRMSANTSAKLFPKSRASMLQSIQAAVSTGSKDAGVGLPTFATLSSEIRIKQAAEVAMSSLMGHLGNYPPLTSSTGITRLSATWDEQREIQRMTQRQKRLLSNQPAATPMLDEIPTSATSTPPLDIDNQFVRYFSYENRVILGFVERPVWANKATTKAGVSTENTTQLDQSSHASESMIARPSLSSQEDEAPCVAMIIRDPTGKHAWWSKFVYEESLKTTGSVTSLAPSVTIKRHAPEVNSSESPTMHSIPDHSAMHSAHDLPISDMHGSTLLPRMLSRHNSTMATASHCSFLPPPYPYTPQNSSVVRIQVFTEDSIPRLDQLCVSQEDIGRNDEMRRKTLEQISAETLLLQSKTNRRVGALPSKSVTVVPPPIVDRQNPATIPQAFRLFMAELGMLDLHNQSKISQLQVSEAFLKDLEKIDRQPERDCITIGVLYSQSGSSSIEQILVPDAINESFEKFIWGLGWPVDIKAHVGFKGNLTPVICETAPYFANSHVEVVFHCPYLLHTPGSTGPSMFPRRKLTNTQLETGTDSTRSPQLQPSSTVSTIQSASRTILDQHSMGYSSRIPSFSIPAHEGSTHSTVHRTLTSGSADNLLRKTNSSQLNEETNILHPLDDIQLATLGARIRTRSHTVSASPTIAPNQFMNVCQQVLQGDIVGILGDGEARSGCTAVG
eukprot:jgi/Hompol1/6881/HPOL_000570-RA